MPRLREVRALVGFRRYHPASEHRVEPDLGKKLNWRSAVEVYGEGVFLTLEEERVAEWEARSSVGARARLMNDKLTHSFMKDRLPPVSARFALLHTLAHLLIRRLADECGYAAASLRERIYCSSPHEGEPRAGFLIYTAAGDVEGTLGGLVRQGEPPFLARTIMGALEDASWCSSDPICSESNGQGFDSLNRAACHACALLPETCCDYNNALLDRTMLVGSPVAKGEELGYFATALEQIRAEAAAEIE